MRLNRLTKLSELMKEAKEQYFNLYNDMKDSIYVEQKGRTVGDAEVLPGKTLSGCITSSDINVHYTNLMGGKDSKIISSSELMALIPSLTTKKGELSPTLNISKALINISIQKYNSANKLAELKKIAEGEIKPGDTEPVNLPPVNPPETKESYIERVRGTVTGVPDEELGSFYDSQFQSQTPVKKEVKQSPVPSADVIDEQHRNKTLTDAAGYTYVTSADGKSLTFSIKGSQPKALNQSYKNWKNVVKNINAIPVSSSTASSAEPVKTQTPEATKPTTGEAAKTQQTGRQFNPTTIANVVAILQRAAKPGGMGLAAGSWTKDERGRIQKIISTINTVNNRIDAYDLLAKILIVTSGAESSFNGALGGDNYVKQIATADRRDVVADRKGKGTFNKQVAFVLDYMNQFYDDEFADDNEGTIRKFLKDFSSGEQPAAKTEAATPAAPAANAGQQPAASAPVTPPATTPEAAPADKADDGAVKLSSRVDPRIKKLATLRRLRVRSQMEAATESSAQFGRSRVS